MVSYNFYADSHILELATDSDRFFIDLGVTSNVLEDDDGRDAVRVYRTPDDVYNLFADYGCAEQCPLEEEGK